MSLERAFVNCRRCYTLASQIAKDWASSAHPPASETIPREQARSEPLWTARNEAMRALEQEITKTSHYDYETASAALKACVTCTYKAPMIGNLIAERKRKFQ